MKLLLKIIVLCALTVLDGTAWAQPDAAQQPALQPIPRLDARRYAGHWHEIAKFPNWFQRKCVSETSADYSVMPEGGLRVVNRCRLANGEIDQAIGAARQIGGESSARLQVRFAPAWLSVVPFVWGDYWVIDLDESYQLAAVSEPKREYLWILSRSPTVDEARLAALLSRLTVMGLDVDKLEKTVQREP